MLLRRVVRSSTWLWAVLDCSFSVSCSSEDLVHREHLPIALLPSAKEGEEPCYSGDIMVDASGRPMAFYTSMPGWQQCAAVGDDSLKVERASGVFAEDDTTRRPFRIEPGEQTLTLRVFVDKAVIEVFANEQACFETLIHPADRSKAPLGMACLDDAYLVFFAVGAMLLCACSISGNWTRYKRPSEFELRTRRDGMHRRIVSVCGG